MYYPKSQITTNLYTNGDRLMYKSNNTPYIGYYWTTSTGKTYTGRTPQDTPTEELIPLSIPRSSQNPIVQEATFNNIESSVNPSLKAYSTLIPSPSSLFIPTYYQPQPTQQDYQIGEFRRYFVKKTNEILYIEVSKETYEAILNKDSKWVWYDYFAFNIPWQITGDKLQVAKTNNNIVDLTMKNLILPKFNLYLRDDYTKFYK